MAEAVFLSAGVPDPKRSAEYAVTANTVAITAAVSALVYVTIGRRLLVWGGHPAITPMIWIVAQDTGIDYAAWVRLYQSEHFRDEFPEDNERFRNVTYTPDVEGDREKSLLAMREKMFSDTSFSAGVFIGGMGGIVHEYELFHRFQPNAAIIPVVSAGGAAVKVAKHLPKVDRDLESDLDYVALFHRHLNISVREERYRRPSEQPEEVTRRYWRPPGTP